MREKYLYRLFFSCRFLFVLLQLRRSFHFSVSLFPIPQIGPYERNDMMICFPLSCKTSVWSVHYCDRRVCTMAYQAFCSFLVFCFHFA
ncbi:hypothetical protein GQ43DRAFT_239798 [Delitschia confertaspora ATCC 74209]|uniref:Secreted protein n=1 Tax=Delitschia confertaspora ATCC 74209 TaxID=1513339 RepID=A0A9P4JSX5_9PLEO|nr:hypothetical protein GQ43DRAFT_239798 [Delitschia confertaspora ATCC 74209]